MDANKLQEEQRLFENALMSQVGYGSSWLDTFTGNPQYLYKNHAVNFAWWLWQAQAIIKSSACCKCDPEGVHGLAAVNFASPAQGDAGRWLTAGVDVTNEGAKFICGACSGCKDACRLAKDSPIRLGRDHDDAIFRDAKDSLQAFPRSGDMGQVADAERSASVMQPKRAEFLG